MTVGTIEFSSPVHMVLRVQPGLEGTSPMADKEFMRKKKEEAAALKALKEKVYSRL